MEAKTANKTVNNVLRYFEFVELMESGDPEYPVAIEDWGDMEVSPGNNYVEIKNMQIHNVGHNGEFAAFINAQFDSVK